MNHALFNQIQQFITTPMLEEKQRDLLEKFPYLNEGKLDADLFCLKLFLLDFHLSQHLNGKFRDKLMDSVLHSSLSIDHLSQTEKLRIQRQIENKIDFFATYASTQLHDLITEAPETVGIAYGIANGKGEEDYWEIARFFAYCFRYYYAILENLLNTHIKQ